MKGSSVFKIVCIGVLALTMSRTGASADTVTVSGNPLTNYSFLDPVSYTINIPDLSGDIIESITATATIKWNFHGPSVNDAEYIFGTGNVIYKTNTKSGGASDNGAPYSGSAGVSQSLSVDATSFYYQVSVAAGSGTPDVLDVAQILNPTITIEYISGALAPEPPVWVMMVAGFFGLGIVMRARGRQSLGAPRLI